MLFLDHAIVFVRDLDRAAAQYRRLGFTLTARGEHPSLGTANHTIMLDRTYLELLTVVTPDSGNRQWSALLARREGFGAIALGTRDARQTRAQLLERGIEVPEVVDFGRPVALIAGRVEARFSVAHLPDTATPVIPAFFCQQHTPEYVWRPEWQHHENTAYHVAALTVVHSDPDQVASRYERLLGRASIHPHPGGVALDLKGTRLWIVTQSYAAARLPYPVRPSATALPIGITLAVRHLGTARRVLTSHEVPFAGFGRGSILIGPESTNGVALELLAA
jgi:hypothetical protein